MTQGGHTHFVPCTIPNNFPKDSVAWPLHQHKLRVTQKWFALDGGVRIFSLHTVARVYTPKHTHTHTHTLIPPLRVLFPNWWPAPGAGVISINSHWTERKKGDWGGGHSRYEKKYLNALSLAKNQVAKGFSSSPFLIRAVTTKVSGLDWDTYLPKTSTVLLKKKRK